jgi:hypothetical protein
MLAAVNPNNNSNFPDARCHSQGELLYYLERHNVQKLILDPLLPGSLSIDSLVKVLEQKHPGIKITILENRPKATGNKPVYAAIMALTIQIVFNLAIQFSTLTMQQITYSGIATVSAFLFFMGGFLWFTKKQ